METGEITLQARDLCHVPAHAGLRSNEAPANHAIQLFGLFRVFGERLEGVTRRTCAKRKTRGATFSPYLEPERDAAANRTTTGV
jgi:hypothetical protein